MTTYDRLETRDPASRERALMRSLREAVETLGRKKAFRGRLRGVEPKSLKVRADLARIPVLRKSDLGALQAAEPPFGGIAAAGGAGVGRLFSSPGGIFEPEGKGDDWWGTARALHAAGFRRGDVVLNTFSYNMTPGGFILDAGARALGCPVIPAGPGAKDQQLELIAHFRPAGYTGTPDFLKILLDAVAEAGREASIRKALVSGAALPPSLRADLEGRGVVVRQAYATADLGCIAYETSTVAGELVQGMTVNEGLIVEIVRPGSDEAVPDGEVGEVVVTRVDPVYPLIRFGTGDLSAVLEGPSPCGRTNLRIKGWMGRADQRTKVKGMFVDPVQVDRILKAHPEILRARLVVTRVGEQDEMTLEAETRECSTAFTEAVSATLATATRLRGRIALVAPGQLPNDGRIIVDAR
ncbi:phenylacetate--CoA ligase family protein [Prosthecomicrobium sp. N25]|uniref:phenylacetate--CoA ligase family protein n=1 Tax=Prosthecomicrobium sp. N25 TaxID=3129254 RepID=UPI0030782CD8